MNLVEEFGDDAYKCFGAAYMGDGIGYANPSCNRDVEMYGFQLRSLPGLFALDVETYGKNAYLMWEWKNCMPEPDCYSDCTNEPFDFDRFEYRRKQSAALPFDLERAKAGDKFQVFYGSEWVDAEMDDDIFIDSEWMFESGDNLRMKYPPRIDNENN